MALTIVHRQPDEHPAGEGKTQMTPIRSLPKHKRKGGENGTGPSAGTGAVAFDKNQKRGPDGRWIDDLDWVDASDDYGGRQVKDYFKNSVPRNVREALTREGYKVKAEPRKLNGMPGLQNLGYVPDGVYYDEGVGGPDMNPISYVNTSRKTGAYNPAAHIAAHETGHAFDYLYNKSQGYADFALSVSAPWNDLLREVFEDDKHPGNPVAPVHDDQFFADAFAVATGQATGNEAIGAGDARVRAWMKKKMREMK